MIFGDFSNLYRKLRFSKISDFPYGKLIFSRFRRLKFCKVRSKKRCKIACFLEPRFGKVLGRVLGGFWEPKILDFRTFFDVFSKHFSNTILEGQKIEKSGPKRERT